MMVIVMMVMMTKVVVMVFTADRSATTPVTLFQWFFFRSNRMVNF